MTKKGKRTIRRNWENLRAQNPTSFTHVQVWFPIPCYLLFPVTSFGCNFQWTRAGLDALGRARVTSSAPLRRVAGSAHCYTFGCGLGEAGVRRGWGGGGGGGRSWHGKVTSNPGIKEPRQYWGSCASGPHTVIHQIRTSSSTSLYRLDSRSIATCLEWLTITCGIWTQDVWHIESFSSA